MCCVDVEVGDNVAQIVSIFCQPESFFNVAAFQERFCTVYELDSLLLSCSCAFNHIWQAILLQSKLLPLNA